MRVSSSHTRLRRWRGGRVAPLAGWLIVVAAAGVLLLQGRGQAETTPQAENQSQVDTTRGATVYAANCTACHGSDGEGRPGTDRAAGPALLGVDAAYVDLTLRTGRMPLLAPDVGVVPPPDGLDDEDREAVVEWMVQAMDLSDSRPTPPIEGDVARGHELYAQHCAACHGATGAGGVSGEGTLIRPVVGVDRVAAAEAIRVGPFRMPRFAPEQLSDEEVADIATFVDVLGDSGQGPLGLVEIDRVAMAVLVIPTILACAGVVLLASRPVDIARSGPRRTSDDAPAPGGAA